MTAPGARRRLLGGLAVAAVAALALLAFLVLGHDDDPHLATLRSDPLASAAVPGLTEVDVTTRGTGSALGKPLHARYGRYFTNGSPAITQADLDRVAALARESGWHVDRLVNGRYSGAKTVSGTRASLVITVDATVSPQRLVLSLTSID